MAAESYIWSSHKKHHIFTAHPDREANTSTVAMEADGLPPHLSALVDASSGSLGSLLTATLLYPLDVAKTRVQGGRAAKSSVTTVLLNLLRSEPGALLRGLGPKAVHTVLQNFLYFYNYSALKSAWKAAGLRVSTPANTLYT